MNTVLDASALLAFLLDEPGKDIVMRAITADTCMSVVNFAEVASIYATRGVSAEGIRNLATRLPVPLIDMDQDIAIRAALLTPGTRPRGLSLGDRVCLALAGRMGVPAVTADRVWAEIASGIGITVQLIRG